MIRTALLGIFFLISLCVGCSGPGAAVTGSNDRGETIPASVSDSNQSRTEGILFVEGCEIPTPQKARKRRKELEVDSDLGTKVTVTSTVYEPEVDSEFTRNPFVIPDEQREVPLRRYKLVWLEELKVNGKVFGYNIFAEPLPSAESGANDELHLHKIMTACYDSDGDGRFEYLINRSNAPPKVPSWAVR